MHVPLFAIVVLNALGIGFNAQWHIMASGGCKVDGFRWWSERANFMETAKKVHGMVFSAREKNREMNTK